MIVWHRPGWGIAQTVATSTDRISRKARASSLLTLNGWIAFNLPRAVTALGVTLLFAIVAVHAYVVVTGPALPTYFLSYATALVLGCLLAAFGMTFGRSAAITQWAWNLGSLVCLTFLGVYVATRVVTLPGLVTVTGRWDIAPGSLGMAVAVAFIGLYVTVLSGVNVAFPQEQHWQD